MINVNSKPGIHEEEPDALIMNFGVWSSSPTYNKRKEKEHKKRKSDEGLKYKEEKKSVVV